jgi:hypothetical protein
MIGTKRLLLDGQRLFIERFGVGIAALIVIKRRQIVERYRNTRVIGTERFFFDFQGGSESLPCRHLILCDTLMSEALSEKDISGGVVHDLPTDLKEALTSDAKALETWEDITPLARNEWICWIESAKKAETRTRRIRQGCSSLKDGKRRPCCWPGCPHR